MKISIKFLVLFMTVISYSCSKEAELTERNTIQLVESISEYVKATDTEFELNDAFGLFALERVSDTPPLLSGARYINNEKCVKTETGINMKKYYYPQSSKLDFYAYYPYTVSAAGEADTHIGVVTLMDQNKSNNYTMSDFMTAKLMEVSAGNTPVRLPFKHRLSQIEIKLLPGTGFDSVADLQGAKLTVKSLYTKCNYDLGTDVISDLSGMGDISPKGNGVVVVDQEVSSLKAVVIPQRIEGQTNLFTITIGINNFEYFIPDLLDLESGNKYIFELTLNKSAKVLSNIKVKQI